MPLKYYSSGMYMRLAFAIATEVEPEILLIDESLGVGDAAFQDKAKARLRGLFERTKAVILVSHEMESLRELCTRGIWIEHGRLVADGPIDEIIDRYLEAVAARAPVACLCLSERPEQLLIAQSALTANRLIVIILVRSPAAGPIAPVPSWVEGVTRHAVGTVDHPGRLAPGLV